MTTLRRFAIPFRSIFTTGPAVAVVLVLALVAMPSDADSRSEVQQVREERRQAQADLAAAASTIDSANVEVIELTEALDALQVNVNAQEVALANAERQLAVAEAEQASSEAAVLDLEAESDELIDLLGDRAVSSFVNQGNQVSVFVTTANPMDAARMQSMVEELTLTDVDVAEELRIIHEDLEIERAAADAAAADAEALRAETADQLVALEAARAEQERVTSEAHARLERLLSELAHLEEQDAELARRESAAVAALASDLSNRRGGGGETGRIPIPPADEIVVVRGYAVHQSIAQDVADMIDHAARDGLELGGWGWRDSTTQIRLREEHCGTSDYAIFEMPSHECNPPTARPGASMHERGLAIDITHNGRAISYQQTEAFRWMDKHAAAYGFYNLPSEPWHWSTNGR